MSDLARPRGPASSNSRWLLLSVLIGIVAFTGRPRAQAPTAAFHGIGDLDGGGVGSAVRDATLVGGTIYAVGASTTASTSTSTSAGTPNPPTLDTPALWTWAGSGLGTLTALPPGTGVLSNATAGNSASAYAITSSGAYIASRTRFSSGSRWARVDRSLLPSPTANLDLGTSGVPALAALAISVDGGVVYGQRLNADNTRWPVRYEPSGGFNYPDLTPTGKTWGFPIPRGTSDDGLVMVGAASNGDFAGMPQPLSGLGTNTIAFRYDHATGTTTTIPTLPAAGTPAYCLSQPLDLPNCYPGHWNFPIALSPDGAVTVVAGDSFNFPSGEIYLTNAANEITSTLGSPNRALIPRLLGGMTDDGVVAVTFANDSAGGAGQFTGLGIPSFNFPQKYAYIHNSHGWFHFSSVLAAQGINLVAMGWDPTNLAITGVRTVEGVDLAFGQGRRRTVDATGYVLGAVEGFVAELPAGALAAFNPTPTPPVDSSIVGAWALGANAANPASVITYLANGTFVFINSLGFERGLYNWAGNAAGGAITLAMLYDTNGTGGASGLNGFLGRTLIVTGDTTTSTDTNCGAACPPSTGTRITGSAGSIVGGWVAGNTAQPNNWVELVFTSGGKYFFASDSDLIEIGTFTWDSISGLLTPDVSGGVDQNGDHGLAGDPPTYANLTADGLGLVFTAPDGIFPFNRVIDPATIPVIANTPLSASGVVGQAFSYDVDATNTVTFTATGLPDGLSINSSTGGISGAPNVGGQFAVTIFATNAAGVSDIETLTLTIAIPTPVGTNVIVEPEVSGAPGPGTSLTFGEITTGGTTTVTVVDDLGQIGVPPPGDGNVGIAGVVYEVTTTATYQGLITLCFSYAGIDFGTATPQLFHYENNAWVDITFPDGDDPDTLPDGVHPDTQTVCGATTTLSPFAILVSNVLRKGFYAPVNPIAGILNTVKGGSTVPLKFNVFVNGVNQTTTAVLMPMTVLMVSCDASAPLDPVDFTVAGETSLRYDETAGYFIQNWKVPKTPGCYMVRMTTEQDGLALTARFKVR